MTEETDTIADVRAWVNRIWANLPQSVDVRALGVKSKAPFQLLCTREALIWRTEELARNACDALERNDFATAAILTRAVTENAGLTWLLMDALDARKKYTPEKLSNLLMRMLSGSGKWPEAPKPVHVNDGLRKMEGKIPGVQSAYDSLSEIAHPNWAGVAALYSKDDRPNYITHFGRGMRGVDSSRGLIINALLGSLGAFEYAYNQISEEMPAFLAELESIWPDDPARPDAAP